MNKCKLRCPTVWSTDHTEGQALKRRTGTSGINVFQFLALHRPSNGPWTKRPLPERTMSRGPPPPTRYISRLWAAITIQEDTRNLKDKQTYPVDCRATSPTTQERDSLKSQGRGWPRGPTWRLGISAGNAKVATTADRRKRIQIQKCCSDLSRLNIGNTLTLGTGAWPSHPGRRSSKVCPSTAECFDLV